MKLRTAFGRERMARILFCALALVLYRSELRAEGVNIESDNPAKHIRLEVDKATIGDVLQALHEKYGVELAGNLDAGSDSPISMTFQGSLPDILERLLRNQNYMIIRSKKNATGVEKILIVVPDPSKATKSATPATPASPDMP
jgi:hypothetical protein